MLPGGRAPSFFDLPGAGAELLGSRTWGVPGAAVRTGRKDWAMTEQPRRPVATYTTYQEAERAVDHLSDQGFPVERVAVIGQDVRLVEQVVGRMNYGRAALHGAASGALPGALIGWLFGLLLYALQGGRRDFASVRSMEPGRYDVVVDEAVADEAVRLLGGLRTSGVGGRPAPS